MKRTAIPFQAAALSFAAALCVHGQTTAFTYQGRLNDGSAPATGIYDLRFSIHDAANGGDQVGGTFTNAATTVSNGLFTVTLDFGAGAFTGADRWLEISVRTNGAAPYADLSPRQQLTATPYATRAANFSGAVSDAQLSGNVARLDADQIFSGAINFSNGSNTFSGSFAGNGAGLFNVPGAFPPQFHPGMTSVQAQPNTAYEAAFNSEPVTYILPTDANFGDMVRVYGMAAGGWQVVPGANQVVSNAFQPGGIWVARTDVRNWSSVASSSDGSKLIAAVNNGQIFTSTDSGLSWTPRENMRSWQSVASSADGSKLVAVVNGGQIYTSTDNGENWTAREGSRQWQSVASSADGSKLVAVVAAGQIFTSTDSGINWTARESARNWSSVASSANGSKLIAVVNGGQIYTSIDSGTNWVARESSRSWSSVASSADGSRLVATENDFFSGGGQIYTSTDSGTNWTARASGVRRWSSVASSSDGSKLLAADPGLFTGGRIYISTDSGTNWIARETNRNWRAVASSANGNRLVAAPSGGRIYTSTFTLTGTQGSAVDIFYLGDGVWQPVDYSQSINLANTLVRRDASGSFSASNILASNIIATAVSGDGAGLTALNASHLSSGTVADARLSTNVALLNGNQIFSGQNIFSNSVSGGGITLDASSAPGAFNLKNASGLRSSLALATGVGNFSADAAAGDTVLRTSAGKLLIQSGPAASAIAITTNNFVGIGKVNPATLLDVGGTLTANALNVNGTATATTLGVGTNSPATALHVAAGGDAEISVQSRDAGGRRWTLQSSGVGGTAFDASFQVIDRTVAASRLLIDTNGNVGIGNTSPTNKLHVSGGITCTALVQTSDRNAKENFEPVSSAEVLEKVAALPISRWNFKAMKDGQHLGPMAQDFFAAFGLGGGETTITAIDADGVALAAIQGLNNKLKDKDAEIKALKSQNDSLASKLAELESLVKAALKDKQP